MITLTYLATTVELSPDLFWSDEFNWHPVQQATERSITGALIVMPAQMVGGRPITLEPESDDSAWMTRADIEQLRNWAAEPGLILTLTLRGTTRDVAFRHQDGAALEAKPVVHFSDIGSTDFYLATLRLMEIE